jgi:hypothetical protein
MLLYFWVYRDYTSYVINKFFIFCLELRESDRDGGLVRTTLRVVLG